MIKLSDKELLSLAEVLEITLDDLQRLHSMYILNERFMVNEICF